MVTNFISYTCIPTTTTIISGQYTKEIILTCQGLLMLNNNLYVVQIPNLVIKIKRVIIKKRT